MRATRSYLWLTAVTGLYIAGSVFALGVGWQLRKWAATPPPSVKLGLYPKPETEGGRLRAALRDTLVAPASAEIEPRMWRMSMLFHVAALAAFVGHLRLVREYPVLPRLLGRGGMKTFAAWAGGTAGSLMMAGVLYWIARRMRGPYKELSVPEDYALLALLLGIISAGNYMRFFGDIDSESYQRWFRSVLRLRPELPESLTNSRGALALGTHMLFVDVFLAYFPFSKLMHAAGAFATNYARTD
jgi:nitrate reductase gamma subunit